MRKVAVSDISISKLDLTCHSHSVPFAMCINSSPPSLHFHAVEAIELRAQVRKKAPGTPRFVQPWARLWYLFRMERVKKLLRNIGKASGLVLLLWWVLLEMGETSMIWGRWSIALRLGLPSFWFHSSISSIHSTTKSGRMPCGRSWQLWWSSSFLLVCDFDHLTSYI